MSVMMNVFNGAAYVRGALDSVLAQTFTDWEIVVWDNGSTDATPEVVAACRDPRLRYFRPKEPSAPAHARELAIREARGEWLAFLDHDDLWMPDKLARQVAVADEAEPDVAIIYGRAVSLGHDERDFDHRREYGPLLEGDLFEHLYNDSCFIQMSSVMLRRSAVAAIGGIPDWIEVVSDYYLYLELSRRFRARAAQAVVCRYRLGANSLTHTAEWRMHTEAMQLIERWAGSVDGRLAAIRRRNQSTRLAVAEMRRPGSRLGGLSRLLREGSIGFLVSRPPVWIYRGLRRLVRTPMWRREPPPSPGAARSTAQ